MNIRTKLNFGKYRGFTIEEIFIGWFEPTLEFFHDFVKYRLSTDESYWITLGFADKKQVRVVEYELLEQNSIRLNVEFKINFSNPKEISPFNESDIMRDLNFKLKAGESHPDKFMFGSVNDFVLKQINECNKHYFPFSDAGYIKWCIKEHQNFWIIPDKLEELENLETNSFLGISLQYSHDDVYLWAPIFNKCKVSFSELKEPNYKKFDERRSLLLNKARSAMQDDDDGYLGNSFSYNPYEEHECYFGSRTNWTGDDLTDDIVNDAFEGDPSNYWNID